MEFAPSTLDIALVPVVGGLIGWFTNYLAVKMLFHPRKPVRIFFFQIQGVFPKRQEVLAKKFGEIVARELVSVSEITSTLGEILKSPALISRLSPRIETFIREDLPRELPMLAMFLSPQLIETIKAAFLKFLEPLTNELGQAVGAEFSERMQIETVVQEKVANFSAVKLEQVLLEIMKRELRFVEFIGGIIGVMIGFGQLALFYF